ncbi:MAG: phosphoribosylformylglycinamidine cyclo-ligase [Actinomycetota bacterium]
MDRYEDAGVAGQGEALSSVMRHLSPTFTFPENAEVITSFGHYASVLKLTDDLAIAICTDGVGSKTMIASALDRYDTIGFDVVAMNVNDIICVGARPLAMVDYVAVHTLDPRRTDEILRGLGAAAKEAGIAVPGGEIAQLPGVVGSPGDESAFDLVGACVGTVHPDRVIFGRDVHPRDALIGIASSGIHSNGLTLARNVLLESGHYGLDEVIGTIGRPLGEELLQPTEIYVRAITDLWAADIETRGLVHITGDGFTNLCRLEAEVGYDIDHLPDPPAIFGTIQDAGGVPDEEMFRVFNMGVGFVVVVPSDQVDAALDRIAASSYSATKVGTVTDEAGVVRIRPAGLIGGMVGGDSEFRHA